MTAPMLPVNPPAGFLYRVWNQFDDTVNAYRSRNWSVVYTINLRRWPNRRGDPRYEVKKRMDNLYRLKRSSWLGNEVVFIISARATREPGQDGRGVILTKIVR